MLVGVLLLSGMRAAQAQEYGLPLGDLSLSFDNSSTVQQIDVSPFQPFSWYVFAEVDFGDDRVDGLLAWEAKVDASRLGSQGRSIPRDQHSRARGRG
jgi:hypothetical protein